MSHSTYDSVCQKMNDPPVLCIITHTDISMTARFPDPILRILLKYSIEEDITRLLVFHVGLELLEIIRCLEILNMTRSECISSCMMQHACSLGDLDLARYLIDTYQITRYDHPEVIVNRCFHRNINTNTIDAIYVNSGLEPTKWFTETFDISGEYFSDVFDYACVNGDLEMLKWMKQQFNLGPGYFFSNNGIDIFNRTCGRGQLDTLKWLKTEFKLDKKNLIVSPMSDPYESAIRSQQKETAKWLSDEGLYYSQCVIM